MSVSLTLQERLKQQHQTESETLQNLTQQQLSSLRSELSGIFTHELDTMRSDMRRQLRETSEALREGRQRQLSTVIRYRLLFPMLATVAALLGIFLSGWGVSTWQEYRIEQNRTEIAQQEATIADMAKITGGVNLQRETNGLFVVLPKGAKVDSGWKVGKLDALKITR